MATKFYAKELVSQKIYSASGAPISFMDVGNDMGILKTDHPYLIDQLDSAIARSIGGILPITEEQFLEYEKKSSASPSLNNLVRERFELSQATVGQGLRSHLGANVAGVPSGLTNTAPVGFDVPKETPPKLEVTTEFAKPTVKRAYRKRGTVT